MAPPFIQMPIKISIFFFWTLPLSTLVKAPWAVAETKTIFKAMPLSTLVSLKMSNPHKLKSALTCDKSRHRMALQLSTEFNKYCRQICKIWRSQSVYQHSLTSSDILRHSCLYLSLSLSSSIFLVYTTKIYATYTATQVRTSCGLSSLTIFFFKILFPKCICFVFYDLRGITAVIKVFGAKQLLLAFLQQKCIVCWLFGSVLSPQFHYIALTTKKSSKILKNWKNPHSPPTS